MEFVTNLVWIEVWWMHVALMKSMKREFVSSWNMMKNMLSVWT